MVRAKTALTCLPELFAIEFHRNTLNQPLRFDQDLWLVDIYLDDADIVVVMKSVQCGITEWLIVVAFTSCIQGLSVLYVLPSKTFRNDFVAKRIDGLKSHVPFYAAGIRDTDNKGLKRIWNGYLKVVGSNVEADLKADPAQIAIIDERDECTQGNLPLVDNRLMATKKLTGKEWRKLTAGNPTFLDYGIDADYKKSDQRQWHIPCPSCGHEQALDWFEHFVEKTDDGRYVLRDKEWVPGCGRDIQGFCVECKKPIDRLAPGRWIAQNPESSIHGYHISQLFTSQNTIEKIWNKFQAAQNDKWELQAFYNGTLGLPFTDSEFQITPGLLKRCVKDDYKMPSTGNGCVAGVDIGKKIHVHISELKDGIRHKVFVGSFTMTDDMADLAFVLKAYGVRCCVIDAMPETTLVRKFQRLHRNVWLCRFQKGVSIKEAKPDRKTGEITPDRTQAFDSDYFSYADRDVVLSANYRDLDGGDFLKQMCINTKVLITDDRGNKHYEWTTPAGAADHHHLASVYEWIAAYVLSTTKLTIMGE